MILNTNNLNTKLKDFQNIKKSFFILDYDNITNRQLILYYAKLFAYFLENETQYKKELDYPILFRTYKSNSKKYGYHIKVRKENNIIENIYYRAFFRDDECRVLGDIKRLNFPHIIYDVAFKCKIDLENNFKKKEFELLDVLNYVGIKRKTFYKLINAIKLKRYDKINLILNNINNAFDVAIFENEIKHLQSKIKKIKKIYN
jgi:hypothetical protein